jgi:hypothetical protein
MATLLPQINFVKKEKTAFKIQARRIYLIQVASISLVIIYGLIFIGFLSYSTYLNIQLNQVRKNIDLQKTTLETLSPFEAKYVALKGKAATILTVTNSLYKHQDVMELVFRLLPNNLEVSSFSLDENGQLTFSGSCPSTDELGMLMDNMKNNLHYKSITITNAQINQVSVDDSGKYAFGVIIMLSQTNQS